MNNKKFKKSIIIFLFSFFALLINKTEASSLDFSVSEKVSVNQKFFLDVLVDPESQSINSIGTSVVFDSEIFSYEGFSSKQSSIPVWVEEPKQESRGIIKFSGVIPGGIDRIYDPLNTSKRVIPVVRLFFIANKEGVGEFAFYEPMILKNDGLGTKTSVSVNKKSVSVMAQDSSTQEVPDLVAPEPFSIQIIERSVFGRTPRLAVFSSNDEGGGIQRYEVSVAGGVFVASSSPVPLPYKFFSYEVVVRAYDYSENFREQRVIVSGEKVYGTGIIIGIFAIILGFIRYKFYNKNKVKNEKI